jgi:hypothetical protein
VHIITPAPPLLSHTLLHSSASASVSSHYYNTYTLRASTITTTITITTTTTTTTTSRSLLRNTSQTHPLTSSTMATDLIMPVLPGNQQFSNHFAPEHRPGMNHRRSQSYQIPPGPQISPLSTSDLSNPNNSTPASPKAHHARHVRPMYMPAVLRPNSDFQPPRTTIKPPTVASGNNNGGGSDTEPNSGLSSRRSSNSLITIPGLGGIGHRLTRRSTNDSGKSFNGELDLDLFPQVTDLPTRKHWKVC